MSSKAVRFLRLVISSPDAASTNSQELWGITCFAIFSRSNKLTGFI